LRGRLAPAVVEADVAGVAGAVIVVVSGGREALVVVLTLVVGAAVTVVAAGESEAVAGGVVAGVDDGGMKVESGVVYARDVLVAGIDGVVAPGLHPKTDAASSATVRTAAKTRTARRDIRPSS
jgi:hypothetical protein